MNAENTGGKSPFHENARAANCYAFGVAATLFNPDYAATTSARTVFKKIDHAKLGDENFPRIR